MWDTSFPLRLLKVLLDVSGDCGRARVDTHSLPPGLNPVRV